MEDKKPASKKSVKKDVEKTSKNTKIKAEIKKPTNKTQKTAKKATLEKKKPSQTKTSQQKSRSSTAKTTSTRKSKNQTTVSSKNIKIFGFHDLPLNVTVYDQVEDAKAVVVVVHGMMEHSGRYENFAQFLNKNGYIVITSDLRGHGKTAISKEKLGFGEKDIYNETLMDLQNIIVFAQEVFRLPIYIFGHSYGSFLSQRLVQICPSIEKCVLCGTSNGSSAIMKLGGLVCSLLSPFKGKNGKGGMIEKMCIKAYGRKFKNGNWLTRDEKVFEEYQKDEYCGGSFPFSFYKSMIKNSNRANSGINKIGQKKLFLIVGSADPLSSGGKHVTKLHKIYLKHNVNAKLKIYEGARHELLNETNKNEVYKDVINFYDN